MDLIQALQTKDTVTENGMPTNSTSISRCVDLFFIIGALRGQNPGRILNKFIKAFNENQTIALRILFWSRDVRDGAGERSTFRIIWRWVCQNHPNIAINNLSFVNYLGRWDDHLVGLGTKVEPYIIDLIRDEILKNNQLCAKWMPRKGQIANYLRKKFGMTPKEYRKFLVTNTNVVETKMCAYRWDEIEYSKIPSLAMSRYGKTFKYKDGERFTSFIESLKRGEVKVNTGAIYPYDIIKSLRHDDSGLAQEQWNSLPNYMEGSDEMILPLVDVSGSMEQPVGKNIHLTVMDIALSLGLYISEKNSGQFKDYFMTFSSSPKLQHLSGSLEDRLNQLESSEWGMNTNIERAFDVILRASIQNNVPQSQMPTKILILSDMEFDKGVRNPSDSVMDTIERRYDQSGYKMPQIIFWNLASRRSNIPVHFKKNGVALISGFSPSILKSVLNSDIVNPQLVMFKTIESPKYLGITP